MQVKYQISACACFKNHCMIANICFCMQRKQMICIKKNFGIIIITLGETH